jgi:hypothetical protein
VRHSTDHNQANSASSSQRLPNASRPQVVTTPASSLLDAFCRLRAGITSQVAQIASAAFGLATIGVSAQAVQHIVHSHPSDFDDVALAAHGRPEVEQASELVDRPSHASSRAGREWSAT